MRKSSNITFYPKWVYYVMETYGKCDIFKNLCLQELLEFSQVELSLELHSIVIALRVSWIAWLFLRKMSHETSYSGKAGLHAQVLEIKASAHTPHNKPFFFFCWMKSDIIWQTTHRSFIDLFYAEVFVVTVACYTPSSKEINCNCQQRIELVVTKFITGASCSMHMHCCIVENDISRHFSRRRIFSSNFKKSVSFFSY